MDSAKAQLMSGGILQSVPAYCKDVLRSYISGKLLAIVQAEISGFVIVAEVCSVLVYCLNRNVNSRRPLCVYAAFAVIYPDVYEINLA